MLSPSFNAHSSATLADIAARVIEEFRNEPHPDTANLFDWIEPQPEPEPERDLQFRETEHARVGDCQEDEVNDEFEFTFVGAEANCSPISADELFHNGQIKPVRPVDFDLLLGAVKIDSGDSRSKTTPSSGRMSLRKLMVEDRDGASCSSSEADDLETVPPGTYCVWAPKNGGAAVGASGRKCKKSSSTGSSKRWKLRDLIHRSNSDGKDTFIFLSPAAAKKTAAEPKKGSAEEGTLNCAAASAHYAKDKTTREGEKKKSYLPYKQDIMGILANVNGLSRNLHPF